MFMLLYNQPINRNCIVMYYDRSMGDVSVDTMRCFEFAHFFYRSKSVDLLNFTLGG